MTRALLTQRSPVVGQFASGVDGGSGGAGRASQRRQHALVDHARTLGFGDVELTDQDLGHSGSTLAGRIGFQRQVAQVSLGAVGAVLCLEASRLARNSRDWHHLIDLCSLAGALLIDPEGIYDPHLSNDRLLLGLKGTMSEFELTLSRQRSLEARHQKAVRAELRFLIPVGFHWAGEVLEKRPDLRTQQALDMVFAKFRELGSVRQILLWLRARDMSLPKRPGRRLDAEVVGASPSYSTVLSILNNRIHAGACAFGRTRSHTTIVDERAHVTRNRRAGTEKTAEIIAQMAGRFPEEKITLTLSRLGIRTERGLTWSADRLRAYRSDHDLPALDPTNDKPRERVTLDEAAAFSASAP